MHSEKDIQRFRDIVENIDRIDHFTKGMRASDFLENELVSDAVERCLQRITEAAIQLRSLADEMLPFQDWRQIRDLGNLLRHGYQIIDPVKIWGLCSENCPPCAMTASGRSGT